MNLIIFLVSAFVLILTIIRVIRSRKTLAIEDFYQNDRLLATYLIWIFVNLFLFFRSKTSHVEYFFPEGYRFHQIDVYDSAELLVYVVGPLLLVYIFQLFKRNRVTGEK